MSPSGIAASRRERMHAHAAIPAALACFSSFDLRHG